MSSKPSRRRKSTTTQREQQLDAEQVMRAAKGLGLPSWAWAAVAGLAAGLVAVYLFIGQPNIPPEVAGPEATATALAQASSPVAGGLIKVYFTEPQYPDVVQQRLSTLDDDLTSLINTAQTSVDMAIYQLDLPNVTGALLAANERGCTVRIVTDASIYENPKENINLKQLERAGVTVVAGNPNAIMHNKFVIVDNYAVWTGSWNFTANDTFRYNNNAVVIQSPALAANYRVTFEKMWSDGKFGAQRDPGGVIANLLVGNIKVANYFAPEDDVEAAIVERVNGAQRSIDFMAYSFTDDQIGAALQSAAASGVQVRGVFERTGSETRYSEYGPLKAAGLDVWQDGNPYLMHHKVFIIDGQTTMIGSFNFSENAQRSNDENMIIVDEPTLAVQYTAEFSRVYQQAQSPPNR